ncbi:MAG: hypothetical protein KDI34_05255, partial [Halioglobus sp.]|nr:hypothetical protein [Halioglobus sp.]
MTTLSPSRNWGKSEQETACWRTTLETSKPVLHLSDLVELERETGFEPATSTLARLRSTNLEKKKKNFTYIHR